MKSLALITNVDDMPQLLKRLESDFRVHYRPDCKAEDFENLSDDINVIFTNPNNLKFPFDKTKISFFPNLQAIVTASTGTVHIDTDFCMEKGIEVISIKDELATLERISSTAEHAVLLTLMAIRKTFLSIGSVWRNEWDYSPFIGRQINCLKVGTVGYGRLGKIYLRAMEGMGAECCFYDPYVHESEGHSTKISLEEMFQTCDVVAVNCHVSRETINLVNYELLSNSSVKVLVNTARGEIVDSPSVLRHLSEDKGFTFAADVLHEEQDKNIRNELIDLFRQFSSQVILTPHQGGMTFDARAIAYQKAADLLSIWLQKSTADRVSD